MADVLKNPYGRVLFGRRVITSDIANISDENILEVLADAMTKHELNAGEIEYLWQYNNGNQPILTRSKKIRDDICNRVVENRANEITAFKTSYICAKPIQYISRNTDKAVTEGIMQLNDMMYARNKSAIDKSIFEWLTICGTSYKIILPCDYEEDGAPFKIYSLDPRNTFVVYSTDIDSRRLLGVKYRRNEFTNDVEYSCYSENHYWRIINTEIVESKPIILGYVPIIEYPANKARLGGFEVALPLLDALNNVASNRLDGVEQFVQSFMKFINCDINREQYEEFLEKGVIKVKDQDGSKASIDMMTNELNQTQTQVLKDDLYNSVLQICGIPNRNGGSSTSDTGAAVILRDGWSLAEARASDSEEMYRESEFELLKIALKLCKAMPNVPDEASNIKLSDIKISFTRRVYEAVESKSQVLCSMLANDKIHPQLAFESSGMFIDPESAYMMSMEYYESNKKTITDNGVNDIVREDDKTQSEEDTINTSE